MYLIRLFNDEVEYFFWLCPPSGRQFNSGWWRHGRQVQTNVSISEPVWRSWLAAYRDGRYAVPYQSSIHPRWLCSWQSNRHNWNSLRRGLELRSRKLLGIRAIKKIPSIKPSFTILNKFFSSTQRKFLEKIAKKCMTNYSYPCIHRRRWLKMWHVIIVCSWC